MTKVSVIVPVYNPGPNMDDLVRSVLGQSLPASQYEAIFVDDGSTDGTGERLDALAAEHPNVRVEHIPNSGWPGRPRNVGTDLARGEYVYYVDNDDWLGPEALERLYARARADDADVVVGKVVGHGKNVPLALFRENRTGVTLEWPPLVRLLSPHKLFRKAFLDEHGLRFPEGRRRLEDHVFVVEAYFRARTISVLADYPCYHWVLRDRDRNASWQRLEPVSYYGFVREILDVVERHTEPGELRDRLLAHWYRSKGLWRLYGSVFARRDRDYNREIFDAVRALALERFPPSVDRHLPFHLRVRSALVRTGSFEGVEAMAEFEGSLEARPTVLERRDDGRAVVLRIESVLRGGDAPLSFRREGDRTLWVPPASLAEVVEGLDMDATAGVEGTTVEVVLRAVADREEFPLPTTTSVRLVPRRKAPGQFKVVAETEARLDPRAAAAGGRLTPGEWQVVVVLRVAGFNDTALRLRGVAGDRPAPLTFRITPQGKLDRGPRLRRHVSGRMPWLARAVRRARGAATARR